MAQTRRRRQTKHRGNAAGVIESRGRTGRKPTAQEKRGDGTRATRTPKAPADRRDRPPTWRAAFVKAMIAAAVLLLIFIVILGKHSNGAIEAFPIVLGFYTVVSYYSDKFVYSRNQRKKARQASGGTGGAR